MNYIPSLIFFSTFICSSFVGVKANEQGDHNQPKLIFALDVIRHGDRTPVVELPKSLHKWDLGPGQLTEEGIKQEFELGTHFRKRYIEETKLLPPNYTPETLYVRSTDSDRTLMSASSLLSGLYPSGPTPNGSQPIPIHSFPTESDPLKVEHSNVKKYKELKEKYLSKNPLWIKKFASVKGKLSRWSELTGYKLKKFSDIFNFSDPVIIYHLKKIPLPQGLTEEDVKEIKEIKTWIFTRLYQPKPIADLLGKPIFTLVKDYLQKVKEKDSKLRYVIFSAHDSTILALQSYLNIPIEEIPPYATHVNFSIFEKSNGERYVEFRYNDQIKAIPRCEQSEKCSFEQFLKI